MRAQGGWAAFKAFRDTFDSFGANNELVAGQVAAMAMDSWYVNTIAANSPDADVTVAPFTDRQGNPLTEAGGQAWAIPQGARHPELACDFIATMTAADTWVTAAKARRDALAKKHERFSGVAIDTTAIADDQVDVRSSSDIDGLVVMLTDRPTEIAGRLTAANGLPAPEHFIVAFPADPALWTNQSRRILSVRPATDGEFVIRALPAGDYLLAALTDLNGFDLQDGRFLQALAAAAVPVTIAEHERKRQDLRIR